MVKLIIRVNISIIKYVEDTFYTQRPSNTHFSHSYQSANIKCTVLKT